MSGAAEREFDFALKSQFTWGLSGCASIAICLRYRWLITTRVKTRSGRHAPF